MTDDITEVVPLGYYEWVTALRRIDLPALTKHVGMFAALYADPRTGANVRPGRERLARETGLSVKRCGQHLGALEAAAMLWRVTKGHGGGIVRVAAQYQLAVPAGLLELIATADPDEQVTLPTVGSNRTLRPHSPEAKGTLAKAKGTFRPSKGDAPSPYLSKTSPSTPPARRLSDAPAPAGEEGYSASRWGAAVSQEAAASTATTGWGTGA